MAPRAKSFTTSYESQSNADDINAKVDDSLRSYMDSGDDIFDDEDVDGNGLSRREVIANVRINILKRMAEENRGSRTEAEDMKRAHDTYSTDIAGDLNVMQGFIQDKQTAERELAAIIDEEERDTSGSFGRFFKFRGIKKKNKRSTIRSLEAKKNARIAKIREKAGKWSAIRSNYAKDKVRKRYKAYDGLAKSWYELTHERAISNLPEDASEEDKRNAMGERAIPEEYGKNIIEYTGIYAMDALDTQIEVAEQFPDLPLTAANLPKVPYKESNNALDGDYLMKSHKKILLLSESDQETGIRVRYKFDYNFLGNQAKKQFVAADSEETALSEGPALQEPQRVYAEDAGLESDRRDINGRFLFSEKNAEILHANLRRNGKTVYGFYMNGEFITNDDEGEAVEGEQEERRVAGKQDMKFFGRRNWDKQEKAEKLRIAIRTSPFFQHVNARTIQYYSGYDMGTDYGEAVEKSLTERWEEAGNEEHPLTKEGVVASLKRDPAGYLNLPEYLRPAALAAYLISAASQERGEGEAPFSYTDPNADPVLKLATRNDKKSLQMTCLALLVNEENPGLWRLARSIIVKNAWIVDMRTKVKLNYLPENGQMMRMGLLEELANHQGVFSEVNLEEGDILNFIDSPSRAVYLEELKYRRGAGNWIKRNILNGMLIKEAFGAANTGLKAGFNIKDAVGFSKDRNYSVSDETKDRRQEHDFWLSFGETMASSSLIVGILGSAGVAVGWKFGGDAAAARDYGFQGVDIMEAIGTIAGIVKDITGFCKYVYKKLFKKAPETADEIMEAERERRETLEDLDGGKIKAVLGFIEKILNLANIGRDLASYHVSPDSSGPGVIQNKKWGDLLAYKGPLDYILTTGQNILAIFKDIVDIVVSTKRIGRIDRADAAIETAISALDNPQPNQGDANAVQPENEVTEEQRQLGQAALDNSQAQYFMSLTKAQSRKQRSQAGWDIGNKVLSIARDTANQFVPTVDPFTAGLKAVLTVAPMVTSFLSWIVGKVKYDKSVFKDNIASMLGDKSYAKTSYFDKVLQRETGIISSDYLVDIARIFMSIDTHALAHKPDKSAGELALAKAVVGTMYGNVNDDSVKTVKLENLLKYSGFSEDSDWRAVLRNSLKSRKG